VRIPGNGSFSEFLEDIWAQNFVCSLNTPAVMPWITTETVGHRCATHSWDTTGRLIDQMLQYAAVQDSAAQNSHIAGLLGWCAFDYNSTYYIAENRICYHGVADMYRIPKFSAYFFKSQTDPAIYGPMVFIAHYWEKALVPSNDVWVTSNCDSVELFVNGTSQGKRGPQYYMYLPHPLFKWPAVSYSAGELKAVGYIHGSAVTTFVRHTPGRAVKLVIAPDTNALLDGGDMTRIVVTAVDSLGQIVPRYSDTVRLSASGAGKFLGESPIALEDGKTAFFVQTLDNVQGTISCLAVSSKLPAATATISVSASDPATAVSSITVLKPAVALRDKTMLITGNRFTVPAWAVQTCQVAVFTPMGRLVFEKPITSTIIYLPHQTVANAQQLFIVRIVPKK
jgi:beta-galactosidase